MTDLWGEVFKLDNAIVTHEQAWQWRRRYNPHHSASQVEIERQYFDIEQKKRFYALKALCVANRDDLINTINKLDPSIVAAARNIISSIDACVNDDLEQTMLAQTDSTSI